LTEMEVFQRHSKLLGPGKMKLIREASILVAGLGGLGSVVSDSLYRLGVGKLILLDNKTIDPPDLNRQSLYTSEDLGKLKVDAAEERLKAIHSFSQLITANVDVTDKISVSNLITKCKINGIADCLDNYRSRFDLEKLVRGDIFMIHGGVKNDFGQVTTITSGRSLKSLYRGEEDQEEIEVLPQIVKAIGSIMVQEIVNNILGSPLLIDKLLIFELADFKISKIDLDLSEG
jgi:molybdopterin-synthase adenylyltransferase